jgi:hypothetical protein
MASLGTRGKYAEGKVKAQLKGLESASFTHYRFPDARAGSFTVTPCDYMVCNSGKLTLLEVKEVDHKFRLPHANFSKDQVARMRNFESAGAAAWVLIYFTPMKLWRYESISYFLQREGGSWDMSGFELRPLDMILEKIL